MIRTWTATGLLRETSDPEAMAAFLLTNDLAVFLMRDHVADVLGVDPMGEGIGRWSRVVLETYGAGILALPEPGPATPDGRHEGQHDRHD